MLEEISLNEIRGYAHYFVGPQPDMVLASVAEGNTSGQFWRSAQPKDDIICLLWDKGNNVFYLSGRAISNETINELATLISTQIKGRAIKEGLAHFKIHALSPACEKGVAKIFQNIPLYQMNKLFYVFRKQKGPTIATPGLENVKYALIDIDFLEQDHYQNVQQVKSEVAWMWSSPEKFAEHGFGYAALLGESIVCWCTAEYVSRQKCGIGIETIRTQQNKGFATATAAHFINYCLRHNITPHWECDRQNISSIRVAEKVGFERIRETIVWGGEFLR